MALASLSDKHFWFMMDVVLGRNTKRTSVDLAMEIDVWLDRIVAKRYKQISESSSDPERMKILTNTAGSIYEFNAVGQRNIKSKVKEINEKQIKEFFEKLALPPIECKFSHPHVRAKLEKLMGSNLVSLTDRDYMQKLQERILEDYGNCMMKRIATRKTEEMERMKNLVLTGKIPLDQAPPEMANHPVMLIEAYCNKLIAERRAKIKVPRIYIPTHLYWDDTPDPPSGLTIETGHMFRSGLDRLCSPPDRYLAFSDEEDVEAGYMFTAEDYDRMKYESPLIKELRECQTVEEMYELADKILGVLKTLEGQT